MSTHTQRVRGLVDCAGPWGTLNVGEEKVLDLGIAESLVLGGLAEEVEPGATPQVNAQNLRQAATDAAKVLTEVREGQSESAEPASEGKPSKTKRVKPAS